MEVKGRFYGFAEGRLDEKNRMVLAEKFRRALPSNSEREWVILSIPPVETNRCIHLYSVETWDVVHGKVQSFAAKLEDPEDFLQRVDERTEMVDLDGQGRLLVPQHLADLAGLQKRGDVVMVGRGQYLAIWGAGEYAARRGRGGDMSGEQARRIRGIYGGYSD